MCARFHPFHMVWQKLFAVVILSLGAFSANATYTVIDEELLPTPPVIEPAPLPPAHYTVPFSKQHWGLTQTGRAALDALVPQMMSATVRIVGRPDASGAYQKMATNRSNAIRDYLAKQSVPMGNLIIDTDATPNPQMGGSVYPSDLYISRSPQPSSRQLSSGYGSSPSYNAPSRGISNTARDQLMRAINQCIQAQILDPIIALKLIRMLVEVDDTPLSQNAPVTQPQNAAVNATVLGRAPAPAVDPAPPVIEPKHAIERRTLFTEKTLRENIEEWAGKDNYHVQWNAANAYHVEQTAIVSGDLLDAIDKTCAAAGISMSVAYKAHTIYINDKQ